MTRTGEGTHAVLGSAASRQVLDALLESPEPLDAATVAALLGLHVTTARFHLDRFEAAGLVTRGSSSEHRRGRPRILYRPSGAVRAQGAREQFIHVLAGVVARGGDPDIESENAGRRWADEFAGIVSEDPGDGLVEVLERIGFEPERVREQIRLHACPFRDAARARPQVVCSVHRGLIDGLLETTGSRSQLKPFVESDLCLVDLESSGSAISR